MDLLNYASSGSDNETPQKNITYPAASTALSLVTHAADVSHHKASSSSANAQYALSLHTNLNAIPPPPPRVASHQQSHAHTVHVSSMHSFQQAMHQNNHTSIVTNTRPEIRIGPPDEEDDNQSKRKRKRRRKNAEKLRDLGDDLSHGPWAPVQEQVKVPEPKIIDDSTSSTSSSSSSSSNSSASSTTNKTGEAADDSNAISERTVADRKAAQRAKQTSSVFHGTQQRDYQGRSWIERPRGITPDEDHDCFVPKRVLKTLTGHEAGVWDVALAPKFGHLLLSASTDKTVKVWNFQDDPEDYTNMRTYYGHEQAVRSVAYSADCKSFVSGSFDRSMKVWDLETGQCTGSFTNGSIINQVTFSEKEPFVVMSACKNRTVMQYDLRSGK